MNDLMTARYTTQETASALGHGNFGVFRRNYNASKLDLLPRAKGAGRGEYSYASIVEMMIHLETAATHKRELARMATWGILDALRTTAIPSGTRITPDLQSAFGQFSELEVCSANQPMELRILCTAPEVIFSNEVISRDPENRTWAVYHGRGDNGRARVRLVQDGGEQPASLRDIRNVAFELATEFSASNEMTQLLGQSANYPYLLDLTSTFLLMERRLRFSLEARNAGYKR